MAEQGGPNLTGKKGHFETNKVEGDRSGVLGSVGATEAGVASPYVAPGRHEGDVEPQGGPSMAANLGPMGVHRRGRGRPADPQLHTDTSLRPVRASSRDQGAGYPGRPPGTAFTPDLDDDGDPYLGPRGDPAEGARDSAPRTQAFGGDPYLGARGDPAEGRRDDDLPPSLKR